MKILRGIPISSGLAMGCASIIHKKIFSKTHRPIESDDVANHISLFENSISKSLQELNILLDLIEEEEQKDIIKSHQEILKDEIFAEQIKKIIEDELCSADFAIHKYFDNFIKYIANVKDEYISQRKEDFYDIKNKLLANLNNTDQTNLDSLPHNAIVITEKITPSIILEIMRKDVLGLISQDGTPNSHSAIIAKSISIPIVFDLKNAITSINEDDTVILDGSTGEIIIQPTEKQIDNYKVEIERKIKSDKEKIKLSALPAITSDGVKIDIMGNISMAEETNLPEIKFSDGVGLFRTEFLYYQHNDFPSSQSHFEIYRQTLANITPNKPVYVRVFDIGGDKLNQKFGLENEQNPFLGCRGIRFLLRYPQIFKNQIRGILRASHYGNIKIMLPMVSKVDEVLRSKKIIEDVKEELRTESQPFNDNIKIGIMVEVPSTAILADQFAQICDFFSLGTNDLTQYVLAADRNNDFLFSDFTYYNPAVLNLIEKTIKAGNKAQIPVSICGEMASDPVAVPLLLAMGIKNFSINPDKILEIKQNIKNYSIKNLQEIYKKILAQSDIDIQKYYTQFIQKK
ncbi:MAG: phosphoenolpyruvate--protein phosphotransferase [Candidatus Cloacimonadota bacterium]|nr:phosphoenolpyruvate--protein phosphotransferase [Candidatus Cloacimonadota bacterium]